MKKSLGLALCAGLLAFLAACTEDPAQPAPPQPAAAAAAPASAQQPAAAPAQQQASNNSDDDDPNCQSDDTTGSYLRKHVVCTRDSPSSLNVLNGDGGTHVMGH